MYPRRDRRNVAALAIAAVIAATGGTFAISQLGAHEENEARLPWKARELQGAIQGETGELSKKEHGGEPEDESREAGVIARQFADARMAPGWLTPGAYTQAYKGWNEMPPAAGSWQEVTTAKYNSDDTRYKDYYSNSGAGSSYVSGRPPAVAVDPGTGYLFEAGSVGGVMRSTSRTGGWEPISDALPASASGDLEVIDGTLWYATGDAATGSTTYVGTGVYATSPTGTFTEDSKVGGPELDGDTILSIARSGDRVYVAGAYGVWSHTADLSGDKRAVPWHLEYAPHPEYLPGGTKQFDASSAYQNIAFDVIGDPKHPGHLLAALGWVDGADYNGWYQRSTDGTWSRFKPQGAVKDLQLGKTTFEYSADGSTLYALVQTPIIKGSEFYYSELQGAYVSNTGSFTGPWNKIADANKLANSGSALKAQVPHLGLYFTGYQPGVQAWYNQFLGVDPANPKHVFLGLEEVYESFNGGATWRTTGPYWNFLFSCWRPSVTDPQNGCPTTTHSDQHDIAFGTVGSTPTAFVSNDGGVYSWPLDGDVNKAGHGLDWRSLSEDGSLRILQYYAVDGGKQTVAKKAYERTDAPASSLIVSGGLQDNGGSILFEGESTMGSNFGGDGGDVLVDPNDGCNIVQEYTNLAMRVTNKCAAPTDPNASVDPSKALSRAIYPPDRTGARFTAPFAADAKDITSWIAGAQKIWHNAKGFDIQSGSDWTLDFDLGAGNSSTAVAADSGVGVVGFCGGGCNPQGFTRGIAVGQLGKPGTWKKTGDAGGPTTNVVGGGQLPNRYIGGVAVDPNVQADGKTHALFLAFNGYSRKWVAGPGISTNPSAGVGHVFMSTDNGVTWRNISGNLADVPLSSIKVLRNGAIVAATDLGVVMTPSATNGTWYRLGDAAAGSAQALPLTVVTDLEVLPNGNLYAATYGRGIWKIAGSAVGATTADGGV
jgi:hypothetical protein